MKPEAIIFDVDGTIANSERWGHLPACNEAFKILSLPLEWDWPIFKQLGQDPRMSQIAGTSGQRDCHKAWGDEQLRPACPWL